MKARMFTLALPSASAITARVPGLFSIQTVALSRPSCKRSLSVLVTPICANNQLFPQQ